MVDVVVVVVLRHEALCVLSEQIFCSVDFGRRKEGRKEVLEDCLSSLLFPTVQPDGLSSSSTHTVAQE